MAEAGMLDLFTTKNVLSHRGKSFQVDEAYATLDKIQRRTCINVDV